MDLPVFHTLHPSWYNHVYLLYSTGTSSSQWFGEKPIPLSKQLCTVGARLVSGSPDWCLLFSTPESSMGFSFSTPLQQHWTMLNFACNSEEFSFLGWTGLAVDTWCLCCWFRILGKFRFLHSGPLLWDLHEWMHVGLTVVLGTWQTLHDC